MSPKRVLGQYIECPCCHRLIEAGTLLDAPMTNPSLCVAEKILDEHAKIDWPRRPAPRHILERVREKMIEELAAIDLLLTRAA